MPEPAAADGALTLAQVTLGQMPLAQGALVQDIDWVALGPPVAVALTALAVLVTDLFLAGPSKVWLPWISLGGLVTALLLELPLATADGRGTFCAPAGCSYVVTDLTLALHLILLASAVVVVLLSMPLTAPRPWADDEPGGSGGLPGGEYHFLLLASVAGAVTLAGARDLLTLVVALETLTLPAYALVGLRRDARAGEAAVKFFLLSVASTAVTLFGVALLYAASGGAVHLGALAAGLADPDPRLDHVVAAGTVLTLAGFLFKIAAVPFHFWVPDTYRGAPVPVAAFLSVVSKVGGFTALLLVCGIALPGRTDLWALPLAVLAALTLTAGNLVAMRQSDAVRLLAWSSIAQSGYVLAAFGAAAGNGDPPAAVLPAAVAYLGVYAAMNLGAFAVVTVVVRARAGGLVDDHRGLGHERPALAAALAFFLVCLAGLPPGLAGLFAKVAVFRSAVDGGTGWLAVVMAVNVVLGLYYYVRWAALLYAAPRPAAEARGSQAAGPDAGTPGAAGPDAGTPGGADMGAADAGGGGTVTAARTAVAAPVRVPVPLGVAVVLTTAATVALSLAPQLVLRVLTLPGIVE